LHGTDSTARARQDDAKKSTIPHFRTPGCRGGIERGHVGPEGKAIDNLNDVRNLCGRLVDALQLKKSCPDRQQVQQMVRKCPDSQDRAQQLSPCRPPLLAPTPKEDDETS
jgi:hypothetical protein